MYSDKISRVLYIYSMLMRGQILKKKELVQDIGVSARSIQRDLENIRDFLDKKYVKEGYGSQLIYNYHEKGYCLEDQQNSFGKPCFYKKGNDVHTGQAD